MESRMFCVALVAALMLTGPAMASPSYVLMMTPKRGQPGTKQVGPESGKVWTLEVQTFSLQPDRAGRAGGEKAGKVKIELQPGRYDAKLAQALASGETFPEVELAERNGKGRVTEAYSFSHASVANYRTMGGDRGNMADLTLRFASYQVRQAPQAQGGGALVGKPGQLNWSAVRNKVQ